MVELHRKLVTQILKRIERAVDLVLGVVLLVDVGIACLQTCHKRVVHQFGNVERGVERVAHVVKLADVEGVIGLALCCLIHPVDDVCAVRVETADHGRKAQCAVAGAYLERAVAFRLQLQVAHLYRVLGIEVGVCRHTQRLVP